MQSYPVRTSHRRNLDPKLLHEIAGRHFERVESTPDGVQASFGAIEHLRVRADGKALSVDVRTNPQVEEAIARESIARYNRFLEEVTGFSSKERARRLRKSAGA